MDAFDMMLHDTLIKKLFQISARAILKLLKMAEWQVSKCQCKLKSFLFIIKSFHWTHLGTVSWHLDASCIYPRSLRSFKIITGLVGGRPELGWMLKRGKANFQMKQSGACHWSESHRAGQAVAHPAVLTSQGQGPALSPGEPFPALRAKQQKGKNIFLPDLHS